MAGLNMLVIYCSHIRIASFEAKSVSQKCSALFEAFSAGKPTLTFAPELI